MTDKKVLKNAGKEKLERIIEMCKAVENRTVDPFLLEVDEIIRVVREYFPHWDQPEELNLDSETIHHLVSVINLQSEWIKHRSTALYTDPFLLEEKINQVKKEEIISIFLQAWRPLIAFEQLTLNSLNEALIYWKKLLPIKERWGENTVREVPIGSATLEEMIKERILGERVFSEELVNFWKELKGKISEKELGGKINYWDFIGAETYEETVKRAFLTSFLITYGYATLEIYPLEEEIFLIPFEEQSTIISTQQSISIPIPVTIDNWQKWKRGESD